MVHKISISKIREHLTNINDHNYTIEKFCFQWFEAEVFYIIMSIIYQILHQTFLHIWVN